MDFETSAPWNVRRFLLELWKVSRADAGISAIKVVVGEGVILFSLFSSEGPEALHTHGSSHSGQSTVTGAIRLSYFWVASHARHA